ncbi:MAG TPA: Gfo/Idh/MocA family oxidoreductase [Terriglobales bacterium]|nr:Gfo/Idh/MocA family oxidoreductase [Terriglobales bacterium]
MIDVGLIGFGFAGKVFHAPIISAVEGLRLASILQRHGNDAAQMYPHAKQVRSLDQLLAIDDIRLVVVATPNTSHYELTRECLLAGRDVVVDKPFVPTYRQAEELVRLAQERGRLLTVYQNLRLNGDFRTVRQIVESGRLGRIALYQAHFDRFRLQLRPNAWRERVEPGSGVFFDLGVHLLDGAFSLFGTPEAISADIRIERDGAVIDDAFDVTLYYPHMRALLRAGMISLAPGLRFLLHGTHGAYVKYGVDPQEEALKRGEVPRDDTWGREPKQKWGTLYWPNKTEVDSEIVPTLPGDYRLYYANVRDAILGRAEIAVTHEQMLDVMRALELAHESSRTGRRLSC